MKIDFKHGDLVEFKYNGKKHAGIIQFDGFDRPERLKNHGVPDINGAVMYGDELVTDVHKSFQFDHTNTFVGDNILVDGDEDSCEIAEIVHTGYRIEDVGNHRDRWVNRNKVIQNYSLNARVSSMLDDLVAL